MGSVKALSKENWEAALLKTHGTHTSIIFEGQFKTCRDTPMVSEKIMIYCAYSRLYDKDLNSIKI